MKLKALIVDDEFNARNNLKILIDEFCPELQIIGLVESAAEARIIIEKEKPDVVFLDIAMPKEDGFSLLKSYENRDFSVVFTTAYNEFALKAFKENAIDYLEKPISIDDLQKAVQKVMKVHGNSEQRTPAELSELVNEAMEGNRSTISDCEWKI